MTEQEFDSMIENAPTDTFADMFPTMTIDTVDVFKDKQGYTARVAYNDGVVAYPTLWCDSAKQVYLVVLDWSIEIHEQATDIDNNYGLLFYACGYNGQRQTEVEQNCERRGVKIF